MAVVHLPSTLHAHPVRDVALLLVVSAVLIAAMLAAVLALAVAVAPAGGRVDLRWMNFRQEVVRLVPVTPAPYR